MTKEWKYPKTITYGQDRWKLRTMIINGFKERAYCHKPGDCEEAKYMTYREIRDAQRMFLQSGLVSLSDFLKREKLRAERDSI